MKTKFLVKAGLTVLFLFFAAPILLAQTPPPKQEEIKLQGIVFEGESSTDAVVVLNGESVKTGGTFKHFKVIQIDRGSVLIEDLNTQEQFQYGILGEKKLVRAKPADTATKSPKGPFDFLLDFFSGNKKR